MSLSRAPFFSARYFQAPTTQTKDQAIIGKNGLLKISVEGKNKTLKMFMKLYKRNTNAKSFWWGEEIPIISKMPKFP